MMSRIVSIDVAICEDIEGELGYAIGKTSQKSHETGKVLWVYSDGVLLYMTDKYPEKSIVAKCYPGGRKELKRCLA